MLHFLWIGILWHFSCINWSEPTEEDQFSSDTTIRIETPNNGDVVDETFRVIFRVGSHVARARLLADNVVIESALDLEVGAVDVTLDSGAHTIKVEAFNKDGDRVSKHQITVTVNPPPNWVTITSPADGATVTNPVYFSVRGSDSVDQIEILADDWPLGTIEPAEVLSYSFSGTGFSRNITAVGYSAGQTVATDEITITVEDGSRPIVSVFNDHVVDILSTYPTDGTYGYYWPSDGGWLGTTEDIYYQGQLIAEGDPDNYSYCVGLTFEVFMKAWLRVDEDSNGDGTINNMSLSDLTEFRIDWYVRDVNGPGPSAAVENYGIGEEITDWSDVQPGDFLQFWRHSGSGHNAVFIDWELDSDNSIIGFRYWSTQNSTDGIGYNEEYFGSSGFSINPQYFYAARVYMPEDWFPW